VERKKAVGASILIRVYVCICACVCACERENIYSSRRSTATVGSEANKQPSASTNQQTSKPPIAD
jgi:hypothetical protein